LRKNTARDHERRRTPSTRTALTETDFSLIASLNILALLSFSMNLTSGDTGKSSVISYRVGVFLFLAILFSTGTVSGHDTWTIPESGTAAIGETVSLAVGSSHAWDGSEEVPEGYMIVVMQDQDGNREAKTSDQATIAGLYRVFPYTIRNAGLYQVTVYHTEGAWTHIVTNPPDVVGGLWINKNIDDIDIGGLLKGGWSDAWYVETSYPVHCYSRTFIASGNADFSRAGLPAGSMFEIIPETDIRTAGTGNFTVRVLYKGTPLSGVVVRAGMPGHEETVVTAGTDLRGRAILPLNHTGTWLIRADTGTDPRVVTYQDLPKGPRAERKTTVGPVYRYTLVLRSDYSGTLPKANPG
jgi:hypothetical protein